MAITRYQNNNINDLDGLFGSLFPSTMKIPPVDIKEDASAFTISAEIPGYEESEIELFVEKHTLVIKGEKKTEDNDKNEEGRKYLLRERRHVSFERSFTLPENLNEEAISASFKNGILEITLPKLPKAEPKRIEVKLN